MAPKRLPDGRIPVLLSAHADDLVRADARAIAAYLDRFPNTTVAQVARQLHGTRRVRRHRAVLRAADRAELGAALRALATGREHPLIAASALSVAPRRAFVFPGQGRHWPGMGAAAYRAIPCYRAATDSLAVAFEAAGAASPLAYLTSPEHAGAAGAIAETEIQGAQFVHAAALAEVWRACGVVPDLALGQSLGEVAAAFVAGSITLPDAVAVVAARAGVVERLSGCYSMATLGVGAQEADALIAATDGWAELSVVYSDSTVAVSGERGAVLTLIDTVRSRGRFAREITAGFPGHTSLLEPLRDELRERLPESEFAEAAVRFIGGTTGDVVPAGTPFRDYWYANLRSTVRMDRAFATAIRAGAGSFVELSAHPALLFSIGELAGADPAVLVGSTRRDEPALESLSANIVTAAVAEPGYAWADYLPAGGGALPGFPNAPMRAIPMWAHPEPLPPVRRRPTTAVERWVPAPPYSPVSGPPVRLAVVDPGGDGPLLRSLRAAIEAHPAAGLSAPQDAEIVAVLAPALDDVDAAAAAATLTRLIGAGLLDYMNTPGPRCHTVCLVTVRAEMVHADEDPSAGHAALAAMHRSIGFDFPERTFSHLDLPAWNLTAAHVAAVVPALLSGRREAALRDPAGLLFERTFCDASAAAQRPFDPAVLDDVVVTGGAGAVGLHYARYLAEHGARRVVLLSRHPASPEALGYLAAGGGTEFLSPPCDITDRAQLAGIAAEYGGDGASLMVHAAGAATFGPAAGLTADAITDTFAAKVTGLIHLTELWPARPDARILVCSSVSGQWGGRGHAAYSAANRLVDVMAARLRAQGRRCISVRWGLWQPSTDGGGSMADSAGVAEVERSGLRPMKPQQAIEASLREWHDDPLIFSADADRLRIFLGDNPTAARPDVATGEPTEAAVCVVDAVRSQLAAVLGVARPGQIDLAASLFDLGVDSMLALDLRKRLRRTLGAAVSLATLMGDITGAELVEKLEFDRSDEARKVSAESGR